MTTAHQLPKKAFPLPYQVDFIAENKGRKGTNTKRKLVWKFGFAHPPAVFPHLYDANENYIGDKEGKNSTSDNTEKKGVECRGREHEIVLTWSLLTGKAHIYVDSKEIYRHAPVKDEIFNPFSAQFHKGFDLPNAKYNGHHRIDIRCYARTPLGAKNLVVDDSGSKFQQYDLTVDGLSYFSMPAMFELGTNRMWSKVSRWGMMRADSGIEETPHGGGQHGEHRSMENNGDVGPHGRMVDEFYLDKAKRRGSSRGYGTSITKSEYKAMSPKSESDMFGNERNGRSPPPNKLSSIGEDDNLIDFCAEEATQRISQISISRHTDSDVSVLGNDDATTASFMLNTTIPPQSDMSPRNLYSNQYQQQQQQMPHYHDPTFNQNQPQRPWSSAGTVSSSQHTPRAYGVPPSDASFAVPPPPSMGDIRGAFGSTMSMGGSVISPMSNASAGFSPMAPQQQQQYSMQQASQWQSQSGTVPLGSTQMQNSKFDPIRSDPFG